MQWTVAPSGSVVLTRLVNSGVVEVGRGVLVPEEDGRDSSVAGVWIEGIGRGPEGICKSLSFLSSSLSCLIPLRLGGVTYFTPRNI